MHGDYDARTLSSNKETALVKLLAWLCYEFTVVPNNIVGHNQVGQTACPGTDIKNKLPRIRAAVHSRLYPNVQP